MNTAQITYRGKNGTSQVLTAPSAPSHRYLELEIVRHVAMTARYDVTAPAIDA